MVRQVTFAKKKQKARRRGWDGSFEFAQARFAESSLTSSLEAMERLLKKFYKKGRQKRYQISLDRIATFTIPPIELLLRGSWKNVISLGDGPAERQALQELLGSKERSSKRLSLGRVPKRLA